MLSRVDGKPRRQSVLKTPWKRNCTCQNQGRNTERKLATVSTKSSAGNKTSAKTNFVHENIWDAINSVAQKSQPTRVDTRHGNKQNLNNSGLQRQYTQTKDYGQIPHYLLKRKHEQKIDQENYRSYVATKEHRSVTKPIPKEERLEILKGLKDNWKLLNRQYLSISLTLDTYQKQMRKHILETRMKQLEDYIQMFENVDIYVVEN